MIAFIMFTQPNFVIEKLCPHFLLGHGEMYNISCHGICCVFFVFARAKFYAEIYALSTLFGQTCLGMTSLCFFGVCFYNVFHEAKFFTEMLCPHCLLGHSEIKTMSLGIVFIGSFCLPL